MNKSRLESFSDGVFGVAGTLLVLEIAVPVGAHGNLGRMLLQEWPDFAAYSVSFLIVGIIWVNHHAIFDQMTRVDRPLLFLNTFLLLFVVLIPLGTGILAKYLQSSADSHVAAALYSGIMFMMSAGFALIWGYALRTPGVLRVPLTGVQARASLLQFSAGLLVYLVTIGVAFINAMVCLALHALIALYYVFDRATNEIADSGDEAYHGAG